jgi:hypothetical protein
MLMENMDAKCVFCAQTQDVVPLVHFVYRGGDYFICPQHIPVLIHNPYQLAGMLPGADGLQAG